MSEDYFTAENATANLLDNEPELLLGCTQGEFFGSLIVSYFIWLILLLIVFLILIDNLIIAIVIPFALAMLFSIPTFLVLAKIIVKNKRGKPNGYYELEGKLFKDSIRKAFGAKTKFNNFVGTWSKSRSV